jgi:formylglycine-generating enzyme required for sulfatase activity
MMPVQLFNRLRIFAATLSLAILSSPCHAQSCSSDVNGDGRVDGADLALVLSQWGICSTTVTSVAPLHGTVQGGTVLTISGTGFASTSSVTVGGSLCSEVTVLSPTLIRATTPPGAAGPAPIAVTSSSGTGLAPSPFTYVVQGVQSITPSSGLYTGGTPITVIGQFLGGTTSVTFGGVPATAVTVVDANTVTAITPPGSVGAVDVVVAGSKGIITIPGGFSYSTTPLSVNAITPNQGPTTGGTPIVLTGTGFELVTNVTIGGSSVSDLVIQSSTTLTATTPAGTQGPRDLVVTTPWSQASIQSAFTYFSAPSISTVTPTNGLPTGGTPITISGSGFLGTTSVTIGGVPASSVTVVDANTIRALTPPGVEGSRPVSVVSPGGAATLANGFTYATWFTVLEQLPNAAVVPNELLRCAILDTGLPWRVRDITTGIELVLIPPGTFSMGCSPSNAFACETNENPVHLVTLTNPFYIARYELTQAQWSARMGSNPSAFQSPSAEVPSSQVPSRPVEGVTWDAAQTYLAGTGLRLPSEAEWEYACRAGTTTAFHGFSGWPSGTNDDTLITASAWLSSNSGSQTRPVGQLAANGFGLHDMAGNASEWVNDAYSVYGANPVTNPQGGSQTSVLRVRRGGFAYSPSRWARSSKREVDGRDNPNPMWLSGFRVARNP